MRPQHILLLVVCQELAGLFICFSKSLSAAQPTWRRRGLPAQEWQSRQARSLGGVFWLDPLRKGILSFLKDVVRPWCLLKVPVPGQHRRTGGVHVPKTSGHWAEFPGWWVTQPLTLFSFLLSHPDQNNAQIILNSALSCNYLANATVSFRQCGS